MQFPAAAGAALAEYALDDFRRYTAMSETEKQIWSKQQTFDLHTATGDAANVQMDVRLLLEQWHKANPRLVDALAQGGFFKSARVQLALHQNAQRLLHRSELSSKS